MAFVNKVNSVCNSALFGNCVHAPKGAPKPEGETKVLKASTFAEWKGKNGYAPKVGMAWAIVAQGTGESYKSGNHWHTVHKECTAAAARAAGRLPPKNVTPPVGTEGPNMTVITQDMAKEALAAQGRRRQPSADVAALTARVDTLVDAMARQGDAMANMATMVAALVGALGGNVPAPVKPPLASTTPSPEHGSGEEQPAEGTRVSATGIVRPS